jgi:hypothetical protein
LAGQTVCTDCEARQLAGDREVIRRQEAGPGSVAFEAEVDKRLIETVQRVDDGERIVLYETVYSRVDSDLLGVTLAGGFDIKSIQRLGLAGWDLVASVPRTVGVALENTNIVGGLPTGIKAYAGGAFAIAGVHLVLRKELSKPLSEVDRSLLREYLGRHMEE